MPIEHFYGRLSEEFGGALPSVLAAELQRLPVGFLQQILEYRRYADAVAANQVDPKGWNTSPMRITATEIEFALAAAEIHGR